MMMMMIRQEEKVQVVVKVKKIVLQHVYLNQGDILFHAISPSTDQ
jgi:hypothetical protein